MLTQFSRTQLLLGEEAMDRLKNTRIAVFGAEVMRHRMIEINPEVDVRILKRFNW